MPDAPRPNPDQLLAQVAAAAERAQRGRLRIFFGASAGVGKTYAMLEAARAQRTSGVDVVVGYVEPHGRAETERLLEGLEQLPTLAVRQRGITRQEFDLDAALRRRPAILLVDELAHSNLTEGEPKPRHAKRWQDIEELLDAGVSVWSTVNVQHIESLNDRVAAITGTRQQETVPDRIFETADEVELIDLPADELLARLRAGKIYLAEQAARATESFFRVGNLTALRELALRTTADRVDASMRAAAGADSAARPWLARDRVLVAPGPDSQAEQLVRAGKRIADRLDAEWTVVYVETPQLLKLSEGDRNRRVAVLRLAESLGAETVTLDGPSVTDVLLEYALTRNVTRIVIGHPKRHGWRALLRPSTAHELVRRAAGIDVLVIGTHETPAAPGSGRRNAIATLAPEKTTVPWTRYGSALLTTVACTVVAWFMYQHFELTNLVMVYLLGAAIAGLRFGRGPAILASVANVAVLDFLFVPPRFTFEVTDFEFGVTFVIMLIVALALANLTASVRLQTRIAGHRERRTAALYAMSRELSLTQDAASMMAVAMRHVAEVFDSKAMVLMPGSDGRLHYPEESALTTLWRADLSVAQWVYHHGAPAGLGTDTLAGSSALYLPLLGSRRALGVLAVLPDNPRRILLPEQRHLLETFSGQLALSLERAALATEAEAVRVSAETEALRNTLLSSISHDLRTPLAVISGASSTLADNPDMDVARRSELARTVNQHATEMSDLISNVLDLMRFESGHVSLRLDDYDLGDLLGTTLHSLSGPLAQHHIVVTLPKDLPILHVDGRLLGQVLHNLLENAARYTPAGTTLWLSAKATDDAVTVVIEDDGPGLPPGDPTRLFGKFQRGQVESAVAGGGLGLAICKAIISAHGGTIRATARTGGGARFEFTIPIAAPASDS